MELKNFYAQDVNGNIVPGAACTVYLEDRVTLATGLQDAAGAALTNPFTADVNGLAQFAAPNGKYYFRCVAGLLDSQIAVQFADPSQIYPLITQAQASAASASDSATTAQNASQAATAAVNSIQPSLDAKADKTALAAAASGSPTGASLVGTRLPATGASSRTVQSKLQAKIYVDDFGPVGDGTTDDLAAFTAAANYAASLQNGTNRSPIIELGNKAYYLSAATPPATWHIPPGGDINGLPGVSPSFQTDTTRLTGQVFRFSGIDQYSTLYVGDPAYTNQKKTGRVLAAQVMGASNRAAGGLAGFTYSSGRDGADQSCIGIAGQGYNDNTSTPKTVWGGYVEGIRALAGTGNAFGIESSTFNYAASVLSNPYQQPGETTGVTYAYWASALGDFDSTAALGIITAGKKFNRGIVFYNNALTSNEAVVMPFGYKMGWHLSSTSGMASYVQSDILQQYSVTSPCYIRRVRGGTTTANNDLVSFESWSGNSSGTEVVLASSRIYQTSAISGGFATSRLDWSAKTAAGADSFLSLDPTAVFPLTTSGLSSGKASNLWSQVFAATSTISTSDERLKTDIKAIPDKVLDAWATVEFQMFHMKDAKSEKGKEARWHFGVIAQRVKAAFEGADLDPFAYGLLCYDEWDAQEAAKDEETGQEVPGIAAGNRYGIRYEEALVLESALLRRTTKRFEDRLAALEASK